MSQCIYRCVVLPDMSDTTPSVEDLASQCTYRCVVPPDSELGKGFVLFLMSQCTYRCVALPDPADTRCQDHRGCVSMHLQVRGAP